MVAGHAEPRRRVGKPPGPMFLENGPLPPLDHPSTAFSMFLDPPAELGDPATEGVTARVLWGLGMSGVRRDDRAVCHAIEFLKHHQCENGAFWDRWMTCYLPGTATTLIGLAATRESAREPYVQRALGWMKSKQNADGGFGETHRAFREPAHAGRGPSMPAVTALVASALIAMGEVDGDATRASIDYLLSTQDGEGSWPNHGWVNPYVPPDTFYEYELPARSLPLMALGRYLAATEGSG
jgi:squalene-hopene/tetraprenyl-beta-curcumene cyclase